MVPLTDVTVKVLATDASEVVVPAGVVMVTTRCPVGAVPEMVTGTLAVFPSLLTVNVLATAIPVSGTNEIWLAPFKFFPLIVNVKELPASLVIGTRPSITGCGRVTLKSVAPAVAGMAVAVAVFTTTTLFVVGALEAMFTCTSTQVPSVAALSAPSTTVIPSDGTKVIELTEPSPEPLILTFRFWEPMAPDAGSSPVTDIPNATPTGREIKGEYVYVVAGGTGAATWTPTEGDKIGINEDG